MKTYTYNILYISYSVYSLPPTNQHKHHRSKNDRHTHTYDILFARKAKLFDFLFSPRFWPGRKHKRTHTHHITYKWFYKTLEYFSPLSPPRYTLTRACGQYLYIYICVCTKTAKWNYFFFFITIIITIISALLSRNIPSGRLQIAPTCTAWRVLNVCVYTKNGGRTALANCR